MLLLVYKSCLVSDKKQYTPAMLLATTGVLTRLHRGGFFMEKRDMTNKCALYRCAMSDTLKHVARCDFSNTELRILMEVISDSYGWCDDWSAMPVVDLPGEPGDVRESLSRLFTDSILVIREEDNSYGINPNFHEWNR